LLYNSILIKGELVHSPSDRYNPPAFPVVQECGYDDPVMNGMSLRDYFAAKAMNGLLSRVSIDVDEIAKRSFVIADKMLKERSK